MEVKLARNGKPDWKTTAEMWFERWKEHDTTVFNLRGATANARNELAAAKKELEKLQAMYQHEKEIWQGQLQDLQLLRAKQEGYMARVREDDIVRDGTRTEYYDAPRMDTVPSRPDLRPVAQPPLSKTDTAEEPYFRR